MWIDPCPELTSFLHRHKIQVTKLAPAPIDWDAFDVRQRILCERHVCVMCEPPDRFPSRYSYVLRFTTSSPRWLDVCGEHSGDVHRALRSSLLPSV